MAAEHHRCTAFHLGGQDALHGLHSRGVEPRERLVENEQIGFVDERDGQLHTLLVTGRQALQFGIGTTVETHLVDPELGSRLGSRRGHTGETGEVGELLADLHLRVHPAFGGHVAEPPPGRRVDGVPVPGDVTRIDADEPHDGPHRSGLPRTVRAEKPDDLARPHRETHRIERLHIPESLRYSGHLQHSQTLLARLTARGLDASGRACPNHGCRQPQCGHIGRLRRPGRFH